MSEEIVIKLIEALQIVILEGRKNRIYVPIIQCVLRILFERNVMFLGEKILQLIIVSLLKI